MTFDWTAITSHTTNRNTSRFVLYGPHYTTSGGVNLAPRICDEDEDGRGGGFYIDNDAPIEILDVGETGI